MTPSMRDTASTFMTSEVGWFTLVFHVRVVIEGRVPGQLEGNEIGSHTTDKESEIALEKRVSIMRTAAIIRSALNQGVEKEVQLTESSQPLTVSSPSPRIPEDTGLWTNSPQAVLSPHTITAVGYIAGEILHLGPRYEALMASFHADQDWTGCWADYYVEAGDLAQLGWIDEQYRMRIGGYRVKIWTGFAAFAIRASGPLNLFARRIRTLLLREPRRLKKSERVLVAPGLESASARDMS